MLSQFNANVNIIFQPAKYTTKKNGYHPEQTSLMTRLTIEENHFLFCSTPDLLYLCPYEI